MEMHYTKKDIKKSSKTKKFDYDDSGKRPLWSFVVEGQKYAFAKKEDAEIAYARLVK